MKYLKFFILIALVSTNAISCTQQTQQKEEFYLFVGTYTGEGSEGIYLYRFNAADGTVSPADTVSGIADPSYIYLSPDHTALYAVNELADSTDATVSAFSFDAQNGQISLLNRQSSRGGAPCYISTDKNGEAVFVANYLGGSLAMFPINEDGSLEEAKTVIKHQGSSVNENRQESPHVHCTIISPDNRFLFAADLGTDKLTGYAYDSANNSLSSEPAIVYETEKGAGPRHLTFHPSGEYAYLVNELNGSIVAFSYLDGNLDELQTISTLPENYEGAISGADIRISPDGKFLYASNREDLNNIVIYSVDESGMLSKVGEEPSGGVHPRNFRIDPTGRYLLAANRHTDNIVVFERDTNTGLLNRTGTEIEVSQPVSLQMIPVPGN
ncbi:lactonase family protein [Balneolaceae bacterium YR4-1]|uniref:Lactonase family protein n=1 Tax=Halalkalibaculum roseum TaxID=2709311 RepID=A0A6M1SN73_9BACT|nr:lactonase family protein [Halalkalibaculum roseum]NGP76509.1 lactonase family protein [Halalkalibaculum roseum]